MFVCSRHINIYNALQYLYFPQAIALLIRLQYVSTNSHDKGDTKERKKYEIKHK